MIAAGNIDFAAIMPTVARALCGEPNRRLSTRDQLRYGNNGSLSVQIGGKDRGQFYDHEHSVGGGVLDLIRYKTGHANGAAIAWLREQGIVAADEPSMEQRTSRRVVATYVYTDAADTPLYRKVRFHPKTFVFERADARGGWISGKGVMDGVERTLYRLCDLLRAPATTTVYLCEGEKAADVLADRLLITVAAGGAQAWRPGFADHLRGRRVIVLPDHDAAGSTYAETAARSLAGVAQSVAVLPLPGLAPGADVVDWLAAGGTAEELEKLADAAPAWQPGDAAEDDAETPPSPEDDSLPIVDPTTLAAVPSPRRWIVEDWLPVGHVTLNYGDGGTGKTLLAQQLMTSCATGSLWCGREVQKCRSLALFCEDDANELHRRQVDICKHFGLSLGDLADMRWISGVGRGNLLITFERDGLGQLTELFGKLTAAALNFGARLVVVDTAADTFAGNENDRTQVRQFLGFALTRLAQQIDGAVLLNAHPSRTGLSATGDLDGGSTAWSNSARSRWSLARPKAENGAESDADERILTRRKANYAAIGAEIRLRWQRGVLVAPNRTAHSPIEQANQKAEAEQVFLSLLDQCVATGQRLSASRHAYNFAPKLFAKMPERRGVTEKQFGEAMQTLFAARKIVNEDYGRSGDGRRQVVRARPQDAQAE